MKTQIKNPDELAGEEYYRMSNNPYDMLEMIGTQLEKHGLKIVILDIGFRNNYPDSIRYLWKIEKA